MSDLGPGIAKSINDLGQIVGIGQSGPAIWQDGGKTNLNELICPDSGWSLLSANSINNSGQIVGMGMINGQSHAYLLTPIVGSGPYLLTSPSNQVAFIGTNVTFSAAAGGTAPLYYQWRFNGTPIVGATSPSLYLRNITSTNTGFYEIVVSNIYCSARTGATLSVLGPGVVLQRLDSRALASTASDNVDAPLTNIITNPNVLENQWPLLSWGTPGNIGLVADGVTPLLIQFINFDPAFPYSVGFSVQGGSLSLQSGTLASRLRMLGTFGWQPTTNFLTSGSASFAYLAPIKADDIVLAQNEVELTVTLTVRVGSTNVFSTTFKIRKPPVVLVHGYNADSSTWGPGFTSLGRPSDFIIPINYGVGGTLNTVYWLNTYGRFDDLARRLDNILQTTIEDPRSQLHENWAFTRYDVVGHSQGGVLLRMLCNQNNAFSATPFASDLNFYRGRFRRIITIGSPHNGSVLLHYILKLRDSSSPWFTRVIPWTLKGLVQDKFDPFGPQIQQINNPANTVNDRAKFRLIRTTIAGGYPPGVGYCPLSYDVLGLCSPYLGLPLTRGNLFLPRGSDGVVDFDSQGAGAGTIVTTVTNYNISHAEQLLLFGIFPASQTSSYIVANEVTTLLDGSVSQFGPFVLPAPVSNATRDLIDSLTPTLVFGDIISPRAVRTATNFNFAIVPFSTNSIQQSISWFAEVFGTNGVSTTGVIVQVDTNDSRNVTVSVDDAVVGDVVLYASYTSTNGNLIFSKPVIVVSHPAGTTLSGIDLVPSAITLSIGDVIEAEIWGLYTNGARSQLFIPLDQPAVFSSSNPNTVGVDTNGAIVARALGSATVTALFRGFSAQAVIGVLPPTGRPVLESPKFRTNGVFELNFVAEPWKYFGVQTSTNLVDWIYLDFVFSTDIRNQFIDPAATNIDRRFYRLQQF